MNNSLRLLQEYRDKCFVYNILCEKSYEYYSKLKSILSVPLIMSSSIMTILNSGTFEPEAMQIPNIAINAITAFFISIMNNFKLSEKAGNFRNLSLRYMQLLHYIEDKLNSEGDGIDAQDFREIIKSYDDLASQNEFLIPNHIKNKVRKVYTGHKYLPNILNCQTDFIQLQETRVEQHVSL